PHGTPRVPDCGRRGARRVRLGLDSGAVANPLTRGRAPKLACGNRRAFLSVALFGVVLVDCLAAQAGERGRRRGLAEQGSTDAHAFTRHFPFPATRRCPRSRNNCGGGLRDHYPVATRERAILGTVGRGIVGQRIVGAAATAATASAAK